MIERFEVEVLVERSPGRWVTAARWPNGAESMDAARWVAAQIGGRVFCVHTKGWEVRP